jgi:cytidylate kinase
MNELDHAPLHGDRGAAAPPRAPVGLAIAVSRETGARGGGLARRVAHRLGWQVYTGEHLEFLCATEAARQPILAEVPAAAKDWVELRLAQLRNSYGPEPDADGGMPRLILALATQGPAVFVGRGAGFVLPPDGCLHVRVVAPLANRIAHMADFLRLTPTEAAEAVRMRDERRAEFLRRQFGHRPGDLYPYDLVLNSGRLDEETEADIVLAAFNGKRDLIDPESRLE